MERRMKENDVDMLRGEKRSLYREITGMRKRI